MKKLVYSILLVALLLSLWSCGVNTNREDRMENSAKPVTVAMTLSPVTQRIEQENDACTIEFRHQKVSLSISGHSDAAERIMSSIAKIQEDAVVAAQQKQRSANQAEFVSALYLTPGRVDDVVISFYAQRQGDVAGEHPEVQQAEARSFETVTGEPLSIADILADDVELNVLKDLLLHQIQNDAAQLVLNSDYESIVDKRFDTEHPSSAYWYFSASGLIYYFMPYELTSSVPGVLQFEISYTDLNGILDERFIPEETNTATAPKADILGHISKDFDHTYTVVTDEEGEKVGLYDFPEDTSVRICSGYWGIEDNQFYVTQTLFAGYGLTDRDRVEIRTYIPDTMPNIRISVGTDVPVVVYLSQSGKDGSILLLDERVI